MKKIIISGINGFIGSSLCKEFLKKDYFVIGLGRSEFKHKEIFQNKNFKFMQVNNIDNKILKDADIFYHLAWNMGLYNTKDTLLACNIELDNIKMSCEMVEIAVRNSVKKIIFIGSISEEMYYFDKNRNLTNIKGRIYGIAKQTASDICQLLAFDSKIQYVHVLLANTYGPFDYKNKAVAQFIKKMVKNEDLDLIEETDPADWVYIDDTVNALISAGLKGKNNKKYYIGHRKIITFKDYMVNLKNVLNSSSKLNFGVYQEKLGYNYDNLDLNDLYKDTGFECQCDFKESILKTKEWLEKNNK